MLMSYQQYERKRRGDEAEKIWNYLMILFSQEELKNLFRYNFKFVLAMLNSG